MPLTEEQLYLAFGAFRSFRLNASGFLFEKIFGKEMAMHYWDIFTYTYHYDLAAFYGYLDDAYKQELMKYILTVVVPKVETVKCVQSDNGVKKQ